MSEEEMHPDLIAGFKRFARGTAGLVKAATGMERATDNQMSERRATCLACPSGMYVNGKCDRQRGGCGCWLQAKWRVAGERCPMGHW